MAMTDPNVARRITGRGKGKKLGLKKVSKVRSGTPKPPKPESFGGEFYNPKNTAVPQGPGRVIPLRGPGTQPPQADGGFRGRPTGIKVGSRLQAGSRGTTSPTNIKPESFGGERQRPSGGQADGGFRTRIATTPTTTTASPATSIKAAVKVQGPSPQAFARASSNASFKRSTTAVGKLPKPPKAKRPARR